jgi:hypothetical protein
VQLLILGEETIEGNFVVYPEEDEDAARNAHRKARDIDKRINAVAQEGAESDAKVVSDHD